MLLITQKEVIQQAFTDKRFLESKIAGNVILACQFKHIRPILGNRLYDTLVKKVANETVGNKSDVYYQLLNNKVKPALSYFVKAVVTGEGEGEITNGGVQEHFTRTSRGSEGMAIQRKVELNYNIAEALATEITNFLEKNCKLFEQYESKENVQTRVSHPFGIVLKRKRRPRKKVVTDIQTVASCFTHTHLVSSESWLINYEGQLKNDSVQMIQVLDSQGNDITQYANTIWNREAQTVLIEFLDGAWINEGDRTGTVQFCIESVAIEKNTLNAVITADDENATLELLSGTVYNPEYRWYLNETLLDETTDSIPLCSLETGILYCEIWEDGQRKLRVFERVTVSDHLVTNDEEFTLTTEDGDCLIPNEEEEEEEKNLTTNDDIDLTENGSDTELVWD